MGVPPAERSVAAAGVSMPAREVAQASSSHWQMQQWQAAACARLAVPWEQVP
jgi:hypothetical protein